MDVVMDGLTAVGVERVPTEQSATSAAPAVNKPAVAVYTAGTDVQREIKDALSVYMLDALVNSGFYRAIERSQPFLAAVTQEHIHQRSGAVDDNQIRELGKQAGVQYVCVANIAITLGSSQISARIIDVETAEIVASGVSSGPLNTLNDLKQISAAVVFRMLGVRVQVDSNFELMTPNEQRILEEMIAQTIQQSIQESQRKKLPFWVGYGISALGAGITGYAVYENSQMSSYSSRHQYNNADNAKNRRNIAYGIGIPVLLGGISIIIIF